MSLVNELPILQSSLVQVPNYNYIVGVNNVKKIGMSSKACSDGHMLLTSSTVWMAMKYSKMCKTAQEVWRRHCCTE